MLPNTSDLPNLGSIRVAYDHYEYRFLAKSICKTVEDSAKFCIWLNETRIPSWVPEDHCVRGMINVLCDQVDLVKDFLSIL